MFAVINKDAGEMVATTIRTIFAQPNPDAVRTRLETVADMLGGQFPKVKAVLLERRHLSEASMAGLYPATQAGTELTTALPEIPTCTA